MQQTFNMEKAPSEHNGMASTQAGTICHEPRTVCSNSCSAYLIT